MTLHIVFDVDGTLNHWHGPVTEQLCRDLREKGACLWMLSERDNPAEAEHIKILFGLTPLPVGEGDNYISRKRDALSLFKKALSAGDILVYVGDRSEDFVVALMASAIYCAPSALSDEIFKDVYVGMAFFCGGECGRKTMFEGHLSGIL